MLTVHTCATPTEGWSLYNHYIENILPIISSQKEIMDKEEVGSEAFTNAEQTIFKLQAELIGRLYLIKQKMISNFYFSVANCMQKIIDLVTTKNISQQNERSRIIAKNRELNTSSAKIQANF